MAIGGKHYKNKWRLIFALIMAESMLIPTRTQANSDIKFHGTLMAAGCTPEAINVEFGLVSLDMISVPSIAPLKTKGTRSVGVAVQQFIINMNCTGNVDNVEYKWNGTTASFDNRYLSTDVEGLAIEFIDGSTAEVVPPDQWTKMVSFSSGKYNMLAHLIREPNTTTFRGGEFNATATFTVQIP